MLLEINIDVLVIGMELEINDGGVNGVMLKVWLQLKTSLISSTGIKLDFKSIEAVEPSLDILRVKNQKEPINRPVWLNADIIHGPNVPAFMPVVNRTR